MGAFLQELIQIGVYKRSQGRITRQVTFAAIAVSLLIGLWRMSTLLRTSPWAQSAPAIEWWLPAMLMLAGVWLAYRIVNFPAFADFLIAVEAEMNKVSWPTRAELVRASIVVLVMLFLLAFILAAYDLFWRLCFTYLGII